MKLAVATVAALLLGASVTVVPASAVLQYPLLGEITPASLSQEEFREPGQMAYNGHSVIVAEAAVKNDPYILDAVGPSGELEWQLPVEGEGARSVAANENTGDVYVAVGYPVGVIEVFDPAGSHIARIDSEGGGRPVPGGLHAIKALAIDQATGYIYAFDGQSRIIDVFSGNGEYQFQITSAGIKKFSREVYGMAVDDSSGLLLVGDSGEPLEHQAEGGDVYALQASDGAYVTTWTGAGTPQKAFWGRLGLAVEKVTGDVYVTAEGGREIGPARSVDAPTTVDRFKAGGEFESAIDGPPGETFNLAFLGIAVGNEGDVYVLEKCGDREATVCPRFNPKGSIDVFAANPLALPRVSLQAPSEVKPTSVTLRGLVDPEETGEASCEFEFGTTTAYGQSVPCPVRVPNGATAVPVEAKLSGLRSGTTYYYRLDATSVASGHTNTGEGSEDLGQLRTPGPRVVSEGVLKVSGEAASFQASVVPNGARTSAFVEYGTNEAYGSATPAGAGVALGAGGAPVEFSSHVQGLRPSTTYHYRLVMFSELQAGKTEEIDGPDRTFTTQSPAAGFALPDGRLWELVSPAEKRGALFFSLNYGMLDGVVSNPLVAQAAASGVAMAELASAPTEAQPQGYAGEVIVLSTRGSHGWSSRVINPSHSRATGPSLSEGGEYEFFSEDLSRAVIDPFGPFTALSPQASEPTPYIRTTYSGGDVADSCEYSCYEPLVTAANTEAGVKFGGEAEPGAGCHLICGPAFVDATPDLGFVALSSSSQLTQVPNEREGGIGPFYYEWGEGKLQPLYLLPASEGGDGVFAGRPSSVEHQLAEDGNVFFIYKEHLYLHDFKDDTAVRLDIAKGVSEPSAGGVTMLYAASDGSRVVFDDFKRLTSAGSGGLYECVIVGTEHGPSCELQFIGASVGTLIGGSDDGSYLYFEDGNGRLIVDHREGNGWTSTTGPHIGALPKSPSVLAGLGSEAPVTRVSPDGRFLTFMSGESLTGYDNRDATSGEPDIEVYLYDAVTDRLVCASCNPTGAQPDGAVYGEYHLVGGSLTEGSSQWVAANLPPWTRSEYYENRYQPRFLSDSGRLFFDSRDALVPQDVNGAQDVYEYEPPGVGGCTTASASYSGRSGGCVNLISSGASAEESAFMDASEDGSDAFFITAAKLVSADFDNALDVYDAHECSVRSPCAAPVVTAGEPCLTGDACKPAATPQPAIFGAPASATFVGHGNVIGEAVSPVKGKARSRGLSRAQRLARALRACRRRRGVGRLACERAARRRYGKNASVVRGRAGGRGGRG